MKRQGRLPKLVSILVALALGWSCAVFGETKASAADENTKVLYERLERFDFRNDAVLDLEGSDLVTIAAKHNDDRFLDGLVQGKVPLRVLQAVAFERNAELAAARAEVRARAEMYPQTMYIDALAEQYRSFLQGIETRTGGGGMKSGPELLFPGPGVLSFNGRLARLEVEMALEDYAMKLRDVGAELLTMAAEREMLRRSVGVMDETITVLEAFEKSLTSRLSTDKVMYPELARLQSERFRMQNERDSMRRMMDASLAGINRFLGRRPGAVIGQVLLPTNSWSTEKRPTIERAVANRQELRIQKIAIRLLETLLALKTRATLSPLSPGFAYAKPGMSDQQGSGGNGMGDGRKRMDPLRAYRTTFDTGLSTNVAPEYGGQVSYLRELGRRIEAERAKLADLENSTGSELTSALVDLENAEGSARNERTRVWPSLDRAMNSAEAGYRSGQVSFLEWMELAMSRLASKLAAIRYDFAGYKAIGRIYMLTGSCKF